MAFDTLQVEAVGRFIKFYKYKINRPRIINMAWAGKRDWGE